MLASQRSNIQNIIFASYMIENQKETPQEKPKFYCGMGSNGAFSKPARELFNGHVQEQQGRTHMGISFRGKVQASMQVLGLLLASAPLLLCPCRY